MNLEFDLLLLDVLPKVFDKRYMKNAELNSLIDHKIVDDVVLFPSHDFDRYQILHVHSTIVIHQEEVEIYFKRNSFNRMKDEDLLPFNPFLNIWTFLMNIFRDINSQ